MSLVRRFAALVALLALLVGAPIALWVLGRGLLPDDLPSLGEVWNSLTHQDSGGLFLGALVVIGGIAWLFFAVSVLVEVTARIARRPSWRIPGLRMPQAVAAGLIGAILLGATATAATQLVDRSADLATGTPSVVAQWDPTVARMAPSTPTAGAAQAHLTDRTTSTMQSAMKSSTVASGTVASVMGASMAAPNVTTDTTGGAVTGGAVTTGATATITAAPVWVTQKGDTLWSIAERSLGDPMRYPEIVALNTGSAQPGDAVFSSADWIGVGWHIVLPSDATVPSANQVPVEQARAPQLITVQQGDTLWDLAETHLGDPMRYPELASANGIENPDLIHAGDQLYIPGSAGTVAPVVTPPQADTGPGQTGPGQTGPGQTGPDGSADEAGIPGTTDATGAGREIPGRTASQGARDEFMSRVSTTISPQADRDADLDSGNADMTAMMVFGGLGSIAAAGLWTALGLSRRRRRSADDPGVDPGVDLTEQVAGAVGGAGGGTLDIAWLDEWLRALALDRAEHRASWPDVLSAHLGLDGLRLNLSRAIPAPAPFLGVGATWFLPTGAVQQRPATALRSCPPPLPALTSIGSDNDGSALVDLERAGGLRIYGDPGRRRQMLNHLLVELAFSGWCAGTEVRLVGWGVDLVSLAPERVAYSGDLDQVLGELHTRLMDAMTTSAAGGLSLLDARGAAALSAGAPAPQWRPLVVLVDGEAVDSAELARLETMLDELARTGRAGGALVVSTARAGSFDAECSLLELDDDGNAIGYRLPGLADGTVLTGVGLTDIEMMGLLAVAERPSERAEWLVSHSRPLPVIADRDAPTVDPVDDDLYWTSPSRPS